MCITYSVSCWLSRAFILVLLTYPILTEKQHFRAALTSSVITTNFTVSPSFSGGRCKWAGTLETTTRYCARARASVVRDWYDVASPETWDWHEWLWLWAQALPLQKPSHGYADLRMPRLRKPICTCLPTCATYSVSLVCPESKPVFLKGLEPDYLCPRVAKQQRNTFTDKNLVQFFSYFCQPFSVAAQQSWLRMYLGQSTAGSVILLKLWQIGIRAIAQQLRAWAALPEELHSIPSCHIVAHNHL